MQSIVEEKLETNHDCSSEMKFLQEFSTQLKIREDSRNEELKRQRFEEDGGDVEDGEGGEEEEEEEEEEEFSFWCDGAETSPIAAEDAFVDGKIKPIFPLFNPDLLFSGVDSHNLHENLPITPPVKKVFVETIEKNRKTTPENEEVVGPYCEWTNRKAVEAQVSPEICKKSNSTGSSKIWRFKDLVGRSNSDGRDTFVFLNNALPPPPPPPGSSCQPGSSEPQADQKSTHKVIRKVKKTSGKAKTASLSAHEVYLRSKAKEAERRRTYLPYRPELMGFFTNFNGGLSRNVHPF